MYRKSFQSYRFCLSGETGWQKLSFRMTKAKKTTRKSLAFARRYYKRLSIIDLQTEKEEKEKNTFS